MRRLQWLVAALVLASAGCSDRPSEAELQAHVDKVLSEMVFVEGGRFEMGAIEVRIEFENGRVYEGPAAGDPDTYPVHPVTLDGYYIHKFETTFAEYDRFSRDTGGRIAAEWALGENDIRGPALAADGMVWEEARAYCRWLGELTGLAIDLPTEAQWEYAARSRGRPLMFGTDNGRLDFGRNYPDKDEYQLVFPPGRFPPNPLGLYDMTGNIGEWVLDWYDPGYYRYSPEHNPQGPETGYYRIQRGMTFLGSPEGKSVVRRPKREPSNDGAGGGIRCVINQATPLPARVTLIRR